MLKKIVWLGLSCLMVVSLVLASCGPAETEEKEAAGEEEAPVTAPAEEPQYGGTFTVVTCIGGDPASFAQADLNWKINHTGSFYAEMLIAGDLQKGPRGTNEYAFTSNSMIPDSVMRGQIAESWELVDPTHILFNIRKGVMWYEKSFMESREITADDVAFSLNNMLNSPRQSENPLHGIASVTAVDSHTLVVETTQFDAGWQVMWGYGYYYGPVATPPELIEKGDPNDWKDTCGTGPFMIEDYTSGSQIVYAKNPNYWDTTVIDGKEYKLPFVDRIVVPILPDATTHLAALRTAKLDMSMVIGWTNKTELERTNPELDSFRVVTEGTPAVYMRMDIEPFTDLRVRRAMCLAVDNEAVLGSAMYGGDGDILNLPYPPALGEDIYTPMEDLPQSSQELFGYDPEKARELLAEAGFPSGFKTTIDTSNGAWALDLLSMLLVYWDDIGVEVDIVPREPTAAQGWVTGKKHQGMCYSGHTTSNTWQGAPKYMDPDATWNFAMYDVEETTEKYDEARYNPDLTNAERNRLLKEIGVEITDAAGVIMLPGQALYRYRWPWVENWYGEHSVGCWSEGPIHARIWLDLDMKKEMGYLE